MAEVADALEALRRDRIVRRVAHSARWELLPVDDFEGGG